jgi:hypothetical protein
MNPKRKPGVFCFEKQFNILTIVFSWFVENLLNSRKSFVFLFTNKTYFKVTTAQGDIFYQYLKCIYL